MKQQCPVPARTPKLLTSINADEGVMTVITALVIEWWRILRVVFHFALFSCATCLAANAATHVSNARTGNVKSEDAHARDAGCIHNRQTYYFTDDSARP